MNGNVAPARMVSPLSPLALVAVVLLHAAVTAQQPEPSTTPREAAPSTKAAELNVVPILGEVPVLSALFTKPRERVWYPLPGQPFYISKGDGSKKPEIGMGTSLLLRSLRENVPGLESSAWVRRTSQRTTDGVDFSTHEEDGFELTGNSDAIQKARALLDAGVETWKRHTVRVDIRVVQVPRGQPLLAKAAVSPLTGPEFEHLTQKRQVLEEATVTAPTILLHNGQRGSMKVTNQTAYIKDFEIRQVQGSAVADPQIDVISEGLSLDFASIWDEARKELTVRGEIKLTALQRPIKEFTTTLAGFPSSVTIQIPEVRQSSIEIDDLVLRADRGEIGFVATGLVMPTSGDPPEGRPIEIFCKFEVTEGLSTDTVTGKVVKLDELNRVLFVAWPRDAVPDARDRHPFDDSPETLVVLRDQKTIGRARLTGGWNLGGIEKDSDMRVVAIYVLTEGEARIGDLVQGPAR